MANTAFSPKGRGVAVLVGEGFYSPDVYALKRALEEYGAHMQVISKHLGMVKDLDGKELEVDMSFLTASSVLFDAVFVPGGRHIGELRSQGDAIHFINEAFKQLQAHRRTW